TVTDYNGCTAIASATVNTSDAPPVANFEADVTTGCDNLTVNFTDLSNNSPTAWSWTFGDGNTSTIQNPTHTYSNPGTYTVVLEATNAVDSDTHTIIDYIVVGETPVITLSMTEESLLGNDGTATVSDISGGTSPYQYEWSNGSDLVTITGLVADEYCVTVTDANGCMVIDCIDVTQEALPAPEADFEANITTGCGTLSVNFTDLSTHSPTNWYWEFGDGATSDVQNPTHTYVEMGTYTVRLTVTNATDSDTHTITDYIVVGETPALVLSMNPESSALNDGTATVNISNGMTPYSIEWSNSGDTEIITGLSADNYCVTVTDAAGCFETACIDVTYEAGTLEPVAAFEADVTESCGSATVNFTDLSLYEPTIWAWSFGDGSTSDEQNPTYTYSGPGIYTVTLHVSNAEGSDFETKIDYIVVHEMPVVTVDVTPASGEFVADGEAIANISGGATPYSITWSNSDTGATSTGLLPGNYSVVVIDDNGCFTTTPFVVNWVNAVDENLMVYGIYPNPAKDEVFIQFEGKFANSVSIYDMLGQEVIELVPSSDVNRLDISNLQIGVYFVKVTFDGKEFTHKLVIN
ncbi:MAG: PKD domain-containing protein, partial [Clostridia bacterium]|nr:PKD domain-containing protein [Clostridia bacterium]